MPSNYNKQPKRRRQDVTGQPAATGQPFLIDILYADDGTPSMKPDAFEVRELTDVIWRGPLGDMRPFRIIFPTESPEDTTGRPPSAASGLNIDEAGNTSSGTPAPAPALVLDSSAKEGRQTSKLRTKKAMGQLMFDYVIEANGVAVNAVFRIEMLSQSPAIIVEP